MTAANKTRQNENESPTRRVGPWKEENDIIGIEEFFEIWPTEAAALAWYENHRWRNGLFCPRCGGDNAYRVKSGKPLSHRCRDCKEYFSVKIGTPLENSNLSVRKWLLYMHQLLTERKGNSALTMHKAAKTTLHTSWFLAQRIRKTTSEPGLPLFEGIIQVDETWLGGKFGNMHKSKKRRLGGGMANKIMVIGLRDENGRVVLKHLPNPTADAILDFVLTHVKIGSTVCTDGSPAYLPLSRFGYVHRSVNHKKGEYVDVDGFTTNAMEGIWSHLKRKYHGVHHFLSPKHTQRYLDEAAFRINVGYGNGPRTIGLALDRAEGRTLPYKKLIGSRVAVWER